MSETPVILVPIGDPNGIGPEIAVKAALTGSGSDARIILVGDVHVIAHYAGGRPVRPLDLDGLPAGRHDGIEAVDVAGLSREDFRPGTCTAASGSATIAYATTAIRATRRGLANAVVACPHNETAVNASGFAFSGYPSLVAHATGLTTDEVFLMLVGGGLRIVHATLHEGVRTALERIDQPLIIAACRAAHEAGRHMGIERPRIGLFGINPHAGEAGLFGQEDERVSIPAAERLRADGLDIVGPSGADLLLSQGECDIYVAMFHDQGHIPIKLLSERQSTAFSVGGGLLFASVGHGSAANIAGQGIADASPLLSTLDIVTRAIAGAGQDAVA